MFKGSNGFHSAWPAQLRALVLTLMAGLLAAINGCEGWSISDNPPVNSKLVIRVVAIASPLTKLRTGEGLEHDLLEAFAHSLGAKLVWSFRQKPEQALEDLRSGRADISAGRWSQEKIENNHEFVLSGPIYEENQYQVVCPRGFRSQDDQSIFSHILPQRSASNNDSFIENQKLLVFLRKQDLTETLKNEIKKEYPLWQVVEIKDGKNTQKILLQNRNSFCVITDENMAGHLVAAKPWLKVAKTLSSSSSRTILFSPQNSNLSEQFSRWFQKQNRRGLMTKLNQRYSAYRSSLSNQNRNYLLKSQDKRLSVLGQKFRIYAEEFSLPWQLIAAVAFQESHWNETAESYTGVKGIMQLTQNTAKFLGVEDREDLEQSLWGGSKYLRYLINQQPRSIHFRDRLMLALVSYNVGPQGLREAQKKAIENGENPFSYWGIKSHLIDLPSPYRGSEAIEFTERVLGYYEVLLDRH